MSVSLSAASSTAHEIPTVVPPQVPSTTSPDFLQNLWSCIPPYKSEKLSPVLCRKLFDTEKENTLTNQKILNCLGYIPIVGTFVGSYRIYCSFQGLKSKKVVWSQSGRGVIELIPFFGGLSCFLYDRLQIFLHRPTLLDGEWAKVSPTDPDLSLHDLEAPFAWTTDLCIIAPLPNNSLSCVVTRRSKVYGYLPIVGTAVGLSRIYQATKEAYFLTMHKESNKEARYRSFRWMVRGTLETVPLLGGAACILIDMIATQYARQI